MLQISNYNVKEHQMKNLKKFVKENQETIAKHAPKGWKYLGTYFYFLGFGPYHVAVIWEITDYADLDALRDHDDPIFLGIDSKEIQILNDESYAWMVVTKGWRH